MKYIIFTIALAAGVPAMAAASSISVRIKHLLFGLMICTYLFGSTFSINIMSMEHYRGPVRGFEVTLADLIALGLLIGMLLRSGSSIVWRPRYYILLTIFFGYSIFNVYISGYPIYGWFVIWQLFRMGILYSCVINFFSTEQFSFESVRTIMRAYTVSGIILLLISFKQKYLDGLYRTSAFFDHSNTVPSFTLIILCALLVWGIRENRLPLAEQLLVLAAALGLVFSVFATSSRTGMLTAAGSVVCALGIANIRGSNRRSRRAALVIGIFLAAGTVMVLDTLIYRFLFAPKESAEARNEFEIAAEMMADDHRYGVGLNQYSEVLTMEKRYHDHIEVMGNEEQAGVAHHIYLLTAAEMGYVGLYGFMLIIGLLLVSMLWQGFRFSCTTDRLLLGLGVGFCVLYAIGLYEWAFRQSTVLYQYVTAAGFGQALILGKKNGLALQS